MLWTWRQNLGREEKQDKLQSAVNPMKMCFVTSLVLPAFRLGKNLKLALKKENVEMRREIFNTAFSFSREKEPELGGGGCGAQWPSNAERSCCCHLPTQTKKMTAHESTPERFMRINELSERRTWNGNEIPQFEMNMKLEERQLESEKKIIVISGHDEQ